MAGRLRRTVAVLTACVVAAAPTGPVARAEPAGPPTDRQVLDALAPLVASIDERSCFALAVDGRLVTAVNGAAPVVPASNQKVLVAQVALEVLGSDHVFTTSLVGPAPRDGVVHGDVHLVGGGDPVLSEEWFTVRSAVHRRPPLHATRVEALADALAASGVTRITGAVLADDRRYDGERHPPGWSEDLRAGSDGVPVGALVLDDSITHADTIGADPGLTAAEGVRDLLRERGIRVTDAVGRGAAPAGAGVLASVTSAPLSRIVEEMLVTSDNLTAEMLVKEIGLVAGGSGTRTAGLAVMEHHLNHWGALPRGANSTDGSGVSRDNRVTCGQLMAVLGRSTAEGALGAALPRGAQPGSTLASRFGEPGMAGVIRAKTGTLRGVKALSGYYPFGDGEVSFALVLNGPSASDYAVQWALLADALRRIGAG